MTRAFLILNMKKQNPLASHPGPHYRIAMSQRSYRATDLVVLPRTDAIGAVALASELITTAEAFEKSTALPANVAKATTRVKARRDILQKAIIADGIVPNISVRKADTELDLCFSVVFYILIQWARISELLALGHDAQSLINMLFADGIKFVNTPVRDEWATSDTLLKTIADKNLDPVFEKLGLLPLLTLLREKHDIYGKVIGITELKPISSETGKKWDELLDAMRHFVNQVAAMEDPEDAATLLSVQSLLRPLEEFESKKNSSKVEGAPETSGSKAETPA